MKRFAILAGVILTAACAAQAQDAAFDPAQTVAKPSTEVSYQNINEAIQMGAGYGDFSQGAHGTFGKFPANFITPVHTHSVAYHGVVLSGTMTNPFGVDGEENPAQLDGASYWYVPAGEPHATACVSDASPASSISTPTAPSISKWSNSGATEVRVFARPPQPLDIVSHGC